jgi:hypothetical protein
MQKLIEEIFAQFSLDTAQQIIAAIQEIGATADVSEILAKLNFDGWAILFDDMQPLLEQIAQYSGARALTQVEISDVDITKLVNEDAVAWSQFRAAEMVGKKYVAGELVDNPNAEWAITDSTRTYLRSAVTDAMEEGWSNDKLAKEIADNAAFSKNRSLLIARTETAFADCNGRLLGYKRSGLPLKKEWILADTHDDDDECDDNVDAGAIDLDEEFPSGDIVPPGHPRCLCDYTVSMVAEDDDESEDEE